MALLPNFADAELDIAKLRDYCLSPSHPWGKHKSRVFVSALGLTHQDADWFRKAILAALPTQDGVQDKADEYGRRWRVDLLLTRNRQRAVVRTVWLIEHGQNRPRFVTAFVL